MQTDADFISATINGTKDAAIPQFYIKQVKNNFKSNAAGHAVYDAKEYVRIIIPGDRNSVPDRAVKEEDKARWAKAYTAFKNNLTLAPEGMPLETWPLIDINQIEFLKHWNVRTVEQLANLNDMHLQNLGMGARDLKSKAILYLERAKDGSGVSKVVAENEQLKIANANLQEQINGLATRLDEITRRTEAQAAGMPMPAVTVAPAVPAVPAITAADIQRMITEGIAAATAAQPPKNKGGRPKKAQTPEHEMPPAGEDE